MLEETRSYINAVDPKGRRLSRPAWMQLANGVIVVALFLSTGCGATLEPIQAEHFVNPDAGGARDVRIVLVLDSLWIGGHEYADSIVTAASRQWEDDFGIRFIVTERKEKHISGLTTMDQIKSLAKTVAITDDADVVVLFTRSTGLLWPEAAELLGNYVVVSPGLWDSPENMFNHGLGHIFGAGHSPSPMHVMSFVTLPFVSQPAVLSFSPETRGTIETNKWRSFARAHAFRQARTPAARRSRPRRHGK